ncbi:hypothetical protein B0H14DRAFT_2604851 [Mycena olivaceomarginata]|nr:hypothetical protein B0H14DRAFT_2604851 [Mycena olivaceomarginata]
MHIAHYASDSGVHRRYASWAMVDSLGNMVKGMVRMYCASESISDPGESPLVDILVINRRLAPDEPEPESEDSISEMITRYNRLRMKASGSSPPSTLAKSTEHRIWQRGECPIYDGCYHSNTPTNTVGPPVELYYSGFAKFIDDSRPNSPLLVPDTFVCEVANFMRAVARIYKDEPAFSAVVTPILQSLLGRGVLRIANSDLTSPDAAVISRQLKILALAEYKRELGEGGVRCFDSSIAERGTILDAAGGYDRTGKPPHSPVARLTSWPSADRGWPFLGGNNEPTARVLFALREAITGSQQFQDSLPQSPLVSDELLPARFFPHVTSYIGEAGQEIHFKYVAPLERDATCVHADIVVKFARSYGETVHQLLARKSLAPELLYCGPVDPTTSYSGVKMVVMGFVAGKTLGWLRINQQTLSSHLGDELVSILDVIHQDGFVYGDLREPNIMLTDDARKVQLVDFDWAACPQMCNGRRGLRALV